MDVDVQHVIGATDRAVAAGDRDGAPVWVVTARRTFPTTIEDLWDSVTSPERLARWFLPVSGDLRVGGTYQLEGQAGGTVQACEPPTRLAVTWEFDGQVSWLVVALSPAGEAGTLLVLEHTLPDDPHWREFGAGAVGIGWDLTILGLGLHLEGEALDRDEVAAWQATPQAAELVVASGRAWRAAAVAGGGDAAVEGEREDRTRAAYTGG